MEGTFKTIKQNKLEKACKIGKIRFSTTDKFQVEFKRKSDEDSYEDIHPIFEKSKRVMYNKPLLDRPVICTYEIADGKRVYREVLDKEFRIVYYRVKG